MDVTRVQNDDAMHCAHYCISTHAPRVGSDSVPLLAGSQKIYFNPRSPHGERLAAPPYGVQRFISIHAPLVGSDQPRPAAARSRPISIHAPLVGSDDIGSCVITARYEFQSTLPSWRATYKATKRKQLVLISIHAPLVESDTNLVKPFDGDKLFQSTLPSWRATKMVHRIALDEIFQSTLPSWRATSGRSRYLRVLQFQSTLPSWRATKIVFRLSERVHISIHAPLVESDTVSTSIM